MAMNFQKLGDEMDEMISYEDWVAITRLREKGIAVCLFMPCERDGVMPDTVQEVATKAVYDHVRKHGAARIRALRSRAETVIK